MAGGKERWVEEQGGNVRVDPRPLGLRPTGTAATVPRRPRVHVDVEEQAEWSIVVTRRSARKRASQRWNPA